MIRASSGRSVSSARPKSAIARLAVDAEEHVRRLDIAMDDPVPMRMLEPQGQRPDQADDRCGADSR